MYKIYKKLTVFMIAVFVVAGFTSNIMAFEAENASLKGDTSSSLRSTNSFNLYDFDVYDDVIDLGDLSKVEGQVLFTNLHNSSGENNFQLGYAGKLFKTGSPFKTGTLSVLFNTTDSEGQPNGNPNITTATTTTSFNNTGGNNPVTVDKTVTQMSIYDDINKSDSSDFRIAYGVKLNKLRLGLGYERKTSEDTIENGNTTITNKTNLITNTPISSVEDISSDKTRGKTTANKILVGSEYETSSVVLEVDGRLSWGESDEQFLDSVRTRNSLQQTSGYYKNETWTTTGLSAGPDGNTDFLGYGLDVIATHKLNNKFRVKGYAGFDNKTSDLNNKTYSNNDTSVEMNPLGNGAFNTIETIIDTSYTKTSSATVDEGLRYMLGLKGYYDFDQNVSFAFGFLYQPSTTETNTPYTVNSNTTTSMDTNGDGDWDDYDSVNGINDSTKTSTSSYSMKYKNKTERDTISIPVAVEFKATKKLTFRVGARYKITQSKTDISTRYVSGSLQTTTTTTFANGDVDVSQDGYDIPGDTKTSTSSITSSTDYRLGLGYEVSKNLEFNLMGGGYNGEGALGASNWDIYSQVTLRF